MSTLILSVAISCGVKGPPIAPGFAEPPAVGNLSYQVTGGRLVLSWALPTAEGAQELASADVFRLKRPVGKQDCPECPQTFERVAKLPARSGTMTYTDNLTPGFQYYYKIILSDRANRSGSDSNIVHYIPEGNP